MYISGPGKLKVIQIPQLRANAVSCHSQTSQLPRKKLLKHVNIQSWLHFSNTDHTLPMMWEAASTSYAVESFFAPLTVTSE